MNIGAVVLAAVSSFMLGGFWYSPAFLGRIWSRENGYRGQDGHPAKVFGVSFLFTLIAAVVFAHWIGPNPPLWDAIRHGIVLGFGLVAANFGVNYQFSNRSFKLWLIDGGFQTVQFALFGLILGLWH